MIKILILTANPHDTERLRVDAEVRDIQDALKRTAFEVVQRPALRIGDLHRVLLEERPAVVHFAGHGEAGGILLETDEGYTRAVSPTALAELFGTFGGELRCVVLNACHTAAQAEAMAAHIDWVAGQEGEAGDAAARKFATAFYDALGNRRDVAFAFGLAEKAAALEEPDIRPRLYHKPGARPFPESVPAFLVRIAAAFIENSFDLLRKLSGTHTDRIESSTQKTPETVQPHLVDRQDQVEALEDAWAMYLDTAPANPKKRSPLLCILHGPEKELGGFIKRMAQEFLPNRLPKTAPFKDDIVLPLADTKPARLHRCLQEDLAAYFQPYRGSHALLVEANLYDSDWFEQSDGNLLESFIGFWRTHLEELSGPHPCLVFLCFQYTGDTKKTLEAEQYFETLEKLHGTEAFTAQFNLPGIVLPRLTSVSSADARKWMNHPLVRKHPGFHRERLRQGIEKLYANTETYPMGPLSVELDQLLQAKTV